MPIECQHSWESIEAALVHAPPIMFMPEVTIPIVKAMFVTSTPITQPSATRELVLHPPSRHFDNVVPVLLGDFRRRG